MYTIKMVNACDVLIHDVQHIFKCTCIQKARDAGAQKAQEQYRVELSADVDWYDDGDAAEEVQQVWQRGQVARLVVLLRETALGRQLQLVLHDEPQAERALTHRDTYTNKYHTLQTAHFIQACAKTKPRG